MNPKDWHFEVYQEFEFARTQYRMTVIYRGQKFYASHLVADEQLYYMPPAEQAQYLDLVKEMLRLKLEKAMQAYDKENPLEPTKFLTYTNAVNKEWLEAQDEIYGHIKSAYQAMIKQQLDEAIWYDKPSSNHSSGKAYDYVKPRDTYRENATSEFEGVEDLDPTLWNEDGDDGIL